VKERSRAPTKVEFASMMQLQGDKAAWCGGRPTSGGGKVGAGRENGGCQDELVSAGQA
jgi:hypothetical protein